MVFVDESGFSLIPYVAKTWAPVGQTPVLVHQGRWPKFSAISGVTPRGKLYIQVHKETIATEQVIEFLQHLLRHIRRRPLMVFWDGGRPHRSDETRAFLRAHPRIEAHRFPGGQSRIESRRVGLAAPEEPRARELRAPRCAGAEPRAPSGGGPNASSAEADPLLHRRHPPL